MSNQFGSQRLKVGQPVGLFVPTDKGVKQSDGTLSFAPTNDLDHFKCYDVKGQRVKQKVSLSDQFIPEMAPAAVYAPVLLCNPVMKLHNDLTTYVQYPDDHLVCYEIKMEQSTHDLLLKNQFELDQRSTAVEGPVLLCAPSKKRHLEGGNGGNGGKGGRGAG